MENDGQSYGCKIDAYAEIATRLNIGMKTVRMWIREFEALDYIRESQRGHHSKSYSPILQDDDFRDKFKAHIKENCRKQGKIQYYISRPRVSRKLSHYLLSPK